MPFLAALRFLTILPVPGPPTTAAHLGVALPYFPVIGLLLGLLVGATDSLLHPWLPAQVTAALDLAMLALVTGALHLDGLADSADGLFHPGGPERRLAIMRDSRVGGYGVVTVVFVVLVQYAALSVAPDRARFAALLLTPCLGRWAQTLAIAWFPYGRPEGRGTPFHGPAKASGAALATVVTCLAALLLGAERGLALLAVTALLTWLLGRLVLRQLPGLTGDTYGAITEVVQTVALLAFAVGG